MREHRDTRTPAKKYRTIPLDPTEEEEDGASQSRSDSGSPPLGVSPPQEIKMRVRQISQGVEDLGWRKITASGSGRNIDVDPSNSPLVPQDAAAKEEQDPVKVKKPVANRDAPRHMKHWSGEMTRNVTCVGVSYGPLFRDG